MMKISTVSESKMTFFCLEISAKKHPESTIMRYGSIQIGSFRENFEIDLSFWTKERYIRHWRESISRLIEGKNKSCLLTSLSDPTNADFFFWWPMYRDENKVFIQNGVLFLDEVQSVFNPEEPYESVPERETISEDGEQISEWETNVNDLREYLLRTA